MTFSNHLLLIATCCFSLSLCVACWRAQGAVPVNRTLLAARLCNLLSDLREVMSLMLDVVVSVHLCLCIVCVATFPSHTWNRMGTSAHQHRASPLKWRAAAVYLFDEVISVEMIELAFHLGPRYVGHFQGSLSAFQGWPLVHQLFKSHSVTLSEETTELMHELQLNTTDLEALPFPLVAASRVWLSLHGHPEVLVPAHEGREIMGGAIAGRVFGRQTGLEDGTTVLPSLRNGVSFPPFAHMLGAVRCFRGRSIASSLDQVTRMSTFVFFLLGLVFLTDDVCRLAASASCCG